MPKHSHLSLVAAILLEVALSICSVLGQSSEHEKPKLKDFGSSLKRMAWDPEKNAVVEVGNGAREGGNANEEDVIRVETSLVVCDVLVLDSRGRPVQGLTRDDLLVSEDGKKQQIADFSLGNDAGVPRSIVLLIDYSGSQFPFIETSIAAAKTLVDKLSPRDRMAIVTDDVELLIDFTQDKKKLKEKLDVLRKRIEPNRGFLSRGHRRFGRSAQYSALMATLNEAFDSEDQRPIIIFQTDGDEVFNLRNPIVVPSIPPNLPPDLQEVARARLEMEQRYHLQNLTAFSLSDIYRAAEKSRVTIYTIIPGLPLTGLSPDELVSRWKAQTERSFLAWSETYPPKIREQIRAREKDRQERTPIEAQRYLADIELKSQSALAGLATLTGGWTEFLSDASEAADIYSRIFADINRRYIIGYYPSNKEHDGKRRKVTIEVRGHPDYAVMGRKSYYAPGPDSGLF